MKNSEYLEIEKQIGKADAATIYQRWKYGRRLLMDATATFPNGRLRQGVTATLVLASSAAGYKLSSREVQRRLQCGREYQVDSEIQQILAEFDSWNELREANFPRPLPERIGQPQSSARPGGTYPTVGEGIPAQDPNRSEDDASHYAGPVFDDDADDEQPERPYDPRTTQEIIRDNEARGRRLLAATWEPGGQQLALFKPDKLDAESTLADLQKYADEQAEMTARFVAVDRRRYDYLQRLIDAVDGDMSKTWREAEEALSQKSDRH